MKLIVQETAVLAPTEAGYHVLTPAKLVYSTDVPWAVNINIKAGEAWICWEFARDLLDVGALSAEPVGDGDVKVWACEGGDVHIRLSNDNGVADVELDGEDVEEFLLTTYDEVPLGTESIDMDDEIAALLGDAQ